MYYQQTDDKLVKDLQSQFSINNAVLIFGDWSASNTKFHEPFRKKGLLQMLKKNGFQAYLVNEFKTSSICPNCEGPSTKFKHVKNPRPYQLDKTQTVVLYNRLLRCTNHSSHKIYNRDLAAVLNFKKILDELRKTGDRPSCLSRATSSSKRKQ